MDIRSKLITPEIHRAGGDDHQIREEFSFKADKTLTDRQMIVAPKTKKARCLDARHIDYLLYQAPNPKIAVVETKGSKKYTPCDGLQQAIYYVRLLGMPSAYSSNGNEFVEHNFLIDVQRISPITQFLTSQELKEHWETQYTPEQLKIIQQPYYTSANNTFKEPRYYQEVANHTIQAVAKGQQRILLVMATGTDKTYTYSKWIKKSKPGLYVNDFDVLGSVSDSKKPFTKTKPVDTDKVKQSGYLSQYSNENRITKTPKIHTFGGKTLYQKPVKNLEKNDVFRIMIKEQNELKQSSKTIARCDA